VEGNQDRYDNIERVSGGAEGVADKAAHLKEQEHGEEEEAGMAAFAEAAPCEKKKSEIEEEADPEATGEAECTGKDEDCRRRDRGEKEGGLGGGGH